MVRHSTTLRSSKTIAGAALVGLGMFLLYVDLAAAVAWLSYILNSDGSGSLGVMPSFILAVSRIMQANAANHRHLFEIFAHYLLVSFWPLVLVAAGTVMS